MEKKLAAYLRRRNKEGPLAAMKHEGKTYLTDFELQLCYPDRIAIPGFELPEGDGEWVRWMEETTWTDDQVWKAIHPAWSKADGASLEPTQKRYATRSGLWYHLFLSGEQHRPLFIYEGTMKLLSTSIRQHPLVLVGSDTARVALGQFTFLVPVMDAL